MEKILTKPLASSSRSSRSSLRGWATRLQKTLVGLLFGILFVTQIYPLIWLVIYSFKTTDEILGGRFFDLPKALQWVNYKEAFTSGNFFTYMLNSVIVTAVTLVVTVVLSGMVSYAITRFRFRYGSALLVVFLLGIMIPYQSTMLPLMVMFKKLGILDTHVSLILPYIAYSLPLAVFIFCGFMKSIPYDIEESAFVDGASVYRIFMQIILPIITPPMVTVVILTFISIWNEYMMAATFISSDNLKTLPFGVYSFFSQYSTNYGAVGAFLVLSALPVVILYFFMSQKITKGMVAGAVKG